MASLDPLDTIAEAVRSSPFASNGNFDERIPIADDADPRSTRDFLAQQWRLATQELVKLSQHSSSSSIEAHLSDWFDQLWQLHTETTRHYHTVVHLEEMCHYFQIVRSLQQQLTEGAFPADTMTTQEDSSTVKLAIFFHDAVYNGMSSTNEEDSAKLFESFAGDVGIEHYRKQQIVDFILATKKHEVSQEKNTAALSLFLDLDMAVLGKQEAAYMQYAALIRKEFSFVPRFIYCEKRATILETFLQQPRIYGTSVMYKALEGRARANVRKEIELLRARVIPGAND
jgi:predicted metal-dependent HD superfamily phosphohydrolase